MKTLVWVEHDGQAVKDATLSAVTAAAKLGEVHLVVVGQGVGAQLREGAVLARLDTASVTVGASLAEGPGDAVETGERSDRDGSGEERGQGRHAVDLRGDPHGSVLAGSTVPLGEGLLVQLLPEPCQGSPQLRGGQGGGEVRGALDPLVGWRRYAVQPAEQHDLPGPVVDLGVQAAGDALAQRVGPVPVRS